MSDFPSAYDPPKPTRTSNGTGPVTPADAFMEAANFVSHTAGPWTREGTAVFALYHNGHYRHGQPEMVNRFSLHVEHRQGGDARTGEKFGCPLVEAEANARLIAAAPEMLAELKKLCRLYPHSETVEIIAKAEGRTPALTQPHGDTAS